MGRRCSWSAWDPISQLILTHSSTSERLLSVESSSELAGRAARHAALGDPARLAIVDELSVSDRAPVELRRLLDMESNLLAHHLDVLERVGLIERSRSSGDGRRRYVHLLPRRARRPRARAARSDRRRAVRVHRELGALASSPPRCGTRPPASRPLSAGTHPADGSTPARSRPRASRASISAAPHRATSTTSVHSRRSWSRCATGPTRSSTPTTRWLHWSIPDPVPVGTKAAFDAALAELRDRIRTLVALPDGVVTDELHPSDLELGVEVETGTGAASPRPHPPPRRRGVRHRAC